MQVEKHHVEFAFFEETRGLPALHQRQRIHTGGVQNFLNQFRRVFFCSSSTTRARLCISPSWPSPAVELPGYEDGFRYRQLHARNFIAIKLHTHSQLTLR